MKLHCILLMSYKLDDIEVYMDVTHPKSDRYIVM